MACSDMDKIMKFDVLELFPLRYIPKKNFFTLYLCDEKHICAYYNRAASTIH
jgi:hypothetical protein